MQGDNIMTKRIIKDSKLIDEYFDHNSSWELNKLKLKLMVLLMNMVGKQ